MSTAPRPDEMTIKEELDGSAVVDLPEGVEAPAAEANEDDDEKARSAEIAATGSVDPDAEALREQKRLKRQRRKEYHKQVEIEKDIKLNHLTRQNQDLLERLSVLEKRSQGSEVARINKAIEDGEAKINFAKQKMAEAIATGNGELHASAQEMWFESRRNVESLMHIRNQANQAPKRQGIPAPDPQLQRHASEWMADNPWYDPNGKDPDSRRALNEDQILADEGYDPKTPEYWEELDKRLQRILPHRYTMDTDEKPQSRRRSFVTSSGRESAASSGGKNTFTLNPDQVRAMKDAGMWDNPEMRAKMIKRYATEARNRTTGGY